MVPSGNLVPALTDWDGWQNTFNWMFSTCEPCRAGPVANNSKVYTPVPTVSDSAWTTAAASIGELSPVRFSLARWSDFLAIFVPCLTWHNLVWCTTFCGYVFEWKDNVPRRVFHHNFYQNDLVSCANNSYFNSLVWSWVSWMARTMNGCQGGPR